MRIWNEKEQRPNGWTAAGAALLVAFVLLGGIFAIVAASFGIRVATAGLVGRGEARIQIQSAAFRIQAYDAFFTICAAVQANEDRLDAFALELETLEEGSDRYGRVVTNIAGVRAGRAEGIRTYNADAARDYTVGQFRDSDLPYELDASPYPEGGKTTCVN